MIYSWKTIIRHGLPLLTICVLIEIFAGQILQSNQQKLLFFPILLISIPVINGVGGNIGSILGARLASGLHLGTIELTVKDKNMQKNFVTALFMGLVTYSILAILIYHIAYIGNIKMNVGLIEFVSIVLGTGILLILIISVVSVLTAFLSFKKGLDPDDVVAPVVTTVGDTLGIVFLFILIGVVGV
ncbi:MAG: magnesium transporter [Candidatus Thermoplasmatota archaeon]|nr:magnesium transporter [Candidatus Thermoplasmatota archaeon]